MGTGPKSMNQTLSKSVRKNFTLSSSSCWVSPAPRTRLVSAASAAAASTRNQTSPSGAAYRATCATVLVALSEVNR